MHGFNNQGYSANAIQEMINIIDPDVFLCQEHWLTPANLHKFHVFMFGSTAMSNRVEAGILRGRPFGGLMCMIKNDLCTIHSEEQFVIVKVTNFLIINVYLPCVGTGDRLLICEDILENIWSLCECYPSCEYLIAGDFNADLNNHSDVAVHVNSFISCPGFSRCDISTPLLWTAHLL